MRNRKFPWVVYQWDIYHRLSAEESAAVERFDPRAHRPAREPDEPLLDYRARATGAVFEAAYTFCDGRTKSALPPYLLEIALEALRPLQLLGRHDDVLRIVERALRFRTMRTPEEHTWDVNDLMRYKREAKAAIARGHRPPPLPSDIIDGTPLASLPIPKFAINALARIGVSTVGDFVARPYFSMSRLRGVGRRSLHAVMDALLRANIPYEDDPIDETPGQYEDQGDDDHSFDELPDLPPIPRQRPATPTEAEQKRARLWEGKEP